MCVSNIHLVPLGRGRVGLDNILKRTILPPAMGPWIGDARSPKPGIWQNRSKDWGGENGRKRTSRREGSGQGLGVRMPGLSIPPLLS